MMSIHTFLRRFRNKEDGVISIELLFAVPLLLWTLMSTFVYFDAFKSRTISTRAALTVADMISREEQALSPEYIDGTRNLLRALSDSDANPDLRVTVFSYRQAQDDLQTRWSRNRGYSRALSENELKQLWDSDRIPPMADGDVAILLETSTTYTAIANTTILGPLSTGNLDEIEFTTFTVIKPRYSPFVCFDPTPKNLENGDTVC